VHVVDIDVTEAGDVNGWNTIVQLGRAGKILPATVKQGTPRGGAHFFFRTVDPPANKNSFLPGVDIRSTGYYVVIAPSIHPNGGQYKWAEGYSPWDRELAEYPDFMRPSEKPAPAQGTPLTPLPSEAVNGDIIRRASAYLATCDPAIQGCGGHDKLLKAAMYMVQGFLLPEGQAFDLLAHEYNPRCEPPWNLGDPRDAKDFRRKITEAMKLTPQHQPGWLLAEGGHSDEPSLFTPEELKALLDRGQAKDAEESLTPPAVLQQERLIAFTGNADAREKELHFLTRPTGLLGDLCSWINSCARKPPPWLYAGGVQFFFWGG